MLEREDLGLNQHWVDERILVDALGRQGWKHSAMWWDGSQGFGCSKRGFFFGIGAKTAVICNAQKSGIHCRENTGVF